MVMLNVSIIGSTGSIGSQTLDVIDRFPDRFSLSGLAAGSNWRGLLEQIARFKPVKASIADKRAFSFLREAFPPGCSTELLCGDEGTDEIASLPESDLTLVASVGVSGLRPVLAAIDSGKELALATKEALVAGGDLVVPRARAKGIVIRPVDSEHSAIFQCIGSDRPFLDRIILTCSGGALRDFPGDRIASASIADVLDHPNWSMGRKITVDCATLMNKGFEMIEACHLFGVGADQVEIVIHPQSIVHSMVEFRDGSVIAQMSLPDMRLAIQYALSYPERLDCKWCRTDFTSIGQLTFERPDFARFPCLGLAFEAFRIGGTMPASLNAANEEAVTAFLSGRIRFGDVYSVVEEVLSGTEAVPADSLEAVLLADSEARRRSGVVIGRLTDAN